MPKLGKGADDAFQQLALGSRKLLNDLAERSMTEWRFEELAASFGKASRLEGGFWRMGFDAV